MGIGWGKMPKQRMFPLEAVAVYVEEDKLSSDMSKYVRFHVHRHIANEVFAKLRILDESQFEEVEWRLVWGP